MKTYEIDQLLTKELMLYYNKLASKEPIMLVFPNTRGINVNVLRLANPKIIFSITGGLTPAKKKFNTNNYQQRTYYSVYELIAIISKFESIERRMNPLWSDLEKVMFIYEKLCKYLTYEESKYNGRDASRNLLGMITGKSVCSGCALIFKEAMDRINIPCAYQNIEGKHSWNVIKVDEKYHPIELTWDVYEKKDNSCQFSHFCRQDKKTFYSNEYHRNITNEKEEIQYPLEPVSLLQLKKMHKKIAKDESERIITTQRNNQHHVQVMNKYHIKFKNDIPYCQGYPQSTFIRNDGSSFLVIPTGKYDKNVNEYIYLEYNKQTDIIKITKIYSEMDFLEVNNLTRNNIANILLTKDRIKTKVNEYNGYVGYLMTPLKHRYYDSDFEEEVLHKYRT